MTSAPTGPLRLMPAAAFLVVACSLLAGCAGSPAMLTFQSTRSNRVYSQQFDKSYFARNDGGEYDVVLTEDGVLDSPSKPTGPILTSSVAPLSQMVYIRILWQPLRGSKPDTPSATNAIIDWYVHSNDISGQNDHLHYRGAGFVAVYDSRDQARFAIRSARLQLADSTDHMQDPLGESALSGSFDAVRNPTLVASLLQAMRDQTPNRAAAKQPLPQPQQTSPFSAHEGPPPRSPEP